MTDDEIVRQQLIALLRGGNAHLNFDRAVSQFPLDYINRKASTISYSPWELLEHMRICQWDILEFIRNPQYESPDSYQIFSENSSLLIFQKRR